MIGATVAMVLTAVLFVLFGALKAAERGGCGNCEGEGGDCASCPTDAFSEEEWRTP